MSDEFPIFAGTSARSPFASPPYGIQDEVLDVPPQPTPAQRLGELIALSPPGHVGTLTAIQMFHQAHGTVPMLEYLARYIGRRCSELRLDLPVLNDAQRTWVVDPYASLHGGHTRPVSYVYGVPVYDADFRVGDNTDKHDPRETILLRGVVALARIHQYEHAQRKLEDTAAELRSQVNIRQRTVEL